MALRNVSCSSAVRFMSSPEGGVIRPEVPRREPVPPSQAVESKSEEDHEDQTEGGHAMTGASGGGGGVGAMICKLPLSGPS